MPLCRPRYQASSEIVQEIGIIGFISFLHFINSVIVVYQDIRSICESFASSLPNYPHGMIFTFWEQYVHLRFYLTMAVVAALTAIFVILSVTLLNVVAAFLVVFYHSLHCVFDIFMYVCFSDGQIQIMI